VHVARFGLSLFGVLNCAKPGLALRLTRVGYLDRDKCLKIENARHARCMSRVFDLVFLSVLISIPVYGSAHPGGRGGRLLSRPFCCGSGGLVAILRPLSCFAPTEIRGKRLQIENARHAACLSRVLDLVYFRTKSNSSARGGRPVYRNNTGSRPSPGESEPRCGSLAAIPRALRRPGVRCLKLENARHACMSRVSNCMSRVFKLFP